MESRPGRMMHQRGLSLIELMIALALGAILLAGTVMVFQQSKSNSVQDEQIARMQESGRYALRLVSRELSMMGYFGGLLHPDQITGSPTASADCLSGGWVFKFSPTGTYPTLQLTDEATASPFPDCISDAEILPNTDVIAIKRVADKAAIEIDDLGAVTGTVEAGAVYLKTNTTVAALYDAASDSDDGSATLSVDPSSVYKYTPAIFYVRPYSTTAGDGMPALVRETLVNDAMVAQPLVDGIEDFQVEFGIDGGDTDLSADFYTATPTASELGDAVSARIYLLVRSANLVTGYVNDKTYHLGSKDIPAKGDGYYRRVYSTTIQLRNADKLKLHAIN